MWVTLMVMDTTTLSHTLPFEMARKHVYYGQPSLIFTGETGMKSPVMSHRWRADGFDDYAL
ncbi:MAG: hypothetical protein IPH10_02210 [bacterium]|nr:hypothetical protein [bacterium]